MSAPADADVTLSAECIVGQRPGYSDVHDMCQDIRDIPLPYGGGLLLQRRCGCECHWLRWRDRDRAS